jgi:hypothetical protein
MNLPHAIVITSTEQYEEALRAGYPFSSSAVVTDNLLMHEFLKDRNVSSEFIDLFQMKQKWAPINTWACEQASSWIRMCEKNRCFSSIDFATQVHHNFSYVLVQMLRAHHFSVRVLTQYQNHQLTTFSNMPRAHFPKVSGDFWVNYFLNTLADKFGANTKTLSYRSHPSKSSGVRKRIPWKVGVKQWLAPAYGKIYRPEGLYDVMVVGGIHHLETLIPLLKARKKRVLYFDGALQIEKFRFAIKQGIEYACPETLIKTKCEKRKPFLTKHYDELDVAFDHAAQMGMFCFEGRDFSVDLKRYLFEGDCLKGYLERLSTQYNYLENLTRQCHIGSVLLDEDLTADNTMTAGYFKSSKVPVYALSHAMFVVDFSVREQSRTYAPTTLFANSEFEKFTYECRGWDPDSIVVTGTPRYDGLPTYLQGGTKKKRAGERLKLFFCGASMVADYPARGGYLGHTVIGRKDTQVPSFLKTVSIAREYPIDIVFKSREVTWPKFIRETPEVQPIDVRNASDNTFEIMSECDAMITTCWTTAIPEALWLKKPVLLVDLYRVYDHMWSFKQNHGFFAQKGLHIARTEDEVRQQYRRLCERRGETPRPDEYFLGPRDGQNSNRVVNFILSVHSNTPSSGKKHYTVDRQVGKAHASY